MNEYEYLQRQITTLEAKLNRQALIEKPDRMNAWTPIFKTAAYVNATSFTIAGVDLTAYLTIGVKVKLTNATVKYGYVLSSSYSAGTGLTTVNLVANTSYSLASGAITDVYISFADPQDFPYWLNYTPTGISNTNSIKSGRFTINGRLCTVNFRCIFTGAITFTTMPTLPIISSASMVINGFSGAVGVASYLNAGSAVVNYGLVVSMGANATQFSLLSPNGTPISATYPITWKNIDEIYAFFYYEI